MGKKSKEPVWSQKDQQLWDLTTRTVTPLHSGKKVTGAVSAKNAVTAKPSKKTNTAPIGLSKPVSIKPVGSKPKSSFSFQPAPAPEIMREIEPSILKKVRRQRMPIDASLDLHGLNQVQAQQSLTRFIQNAVAQKYRTVIVITGKGLKANDFGQLVDKGVLKRFVPIWLNQPPLNAYVAGISQAARHHGGAGALYVRLKS